MPLLPLRDASYRHEVQFRRRLLLSLILTLPELLFSRFLRFSALRAALSDLSFFPQILFAVYLPLFPYPKDSFRFPFVPVPRPLIKSACRHFSHARHLQGCRLWFCQALQSRFLLLSYIAYRKCCHRFLYRCYQDNRGRSQKTLYVQAFLSPYLQKALYP